MRHFRLLWLVSTLGSVVRPVQAQGTPVPPAIVGTWLLESIADTLASGSVAYWMGPHPTGAIIYTASGHVSVQFMRDPRPVLPGGAAGELNATRLAGADPFQSLGVAELRDVVRGYYAYFGRYQVSAAGDSITHIVDGSLRPNEVGVTYRRAIRIDRNRLFISLRAEVAGVPRHRILRWRRAL
jgi:hypothetical protein